MYVDNSQQYIPPSEQQVTEPKKYTGSAIPSRSFKILQAMTQPENAGKFRNYRLRISKFPFYVFIKIIPQGLMLRGFLFFISIQNITKS